MGYFSNGTEGGLYEERYCDSCIHGDDPEQDHWCPIWALQKAHNPPGRESVEARILNELIPRSKDGLGNEQCTMFVAKAAVADMFDIARTTDE